jgi:very-short-patch-repair endonuclease
VQIPRGRQPRLLKFARALRQQPTEAENKLWQILRMKQLSGYSFRRQHRVDEFILDFYCAARRLYIELDGGQYTNQDQRNYDMQRTLYLNQCGLRVARFSNIDVLKHTDAVAMETLRQLELPPPLPSPGVPGEGESARL